MGITVVDRQDVRSTAAGIHLSSDTRLVMNLEYLDLIT